MVRTRAGLQNQTRPTRDCQVPRDLTYSKDQLAGPQTDPPYRSLQTAELYVLEMQRGAAQR